jgi:acyl CoA:acetate/3-ketoacid CoA transferase beta subunit
VDGEFAIEEVADGFSFEEVQALTDMRVKVAARAK